MLKKDGWKIGNGLLFRYASTLQGVVREMLEMTLSICFIDVIPVELSYISRNETSLEIILLIYT